MPVCESEKLGVSVIGCRFTEKEEHVPIKKRRFVYRSPSPPPRAPSSHSEETEMVSKTRLGIIDCTASASDLGHVVNHERDIDKANLERVKAQVDDNEDFSGISILAAAACIKGFGGEDGHAGDGSGVEESFMHEPPSERPTNNELRLLSKGVSMDHLCSAEISTEGSGSCISALPAENPAACLKTVNSSANHLPHGNKMEYASVQDQPVASEDLSTSKDKETVRQPGLSSLDDRLNWDLNRAMDSWEHPFDSLGPVSNTTVTDGFAEDMDNGKHSDKKVNFQSYELPTDLGDSKQPSHIQERISTAAGSVLVPADDAKRLSASVNEDQSTSDHNVSVGHTIGNDDSSLHGVVSLYSGPDNNLPSRSSYSTNSFAADEDMSISSDSQVEEQEVSPLVALSGDTTGGTEDGLDKTVGVANEISGSLDDTSNLADIVGLETGQLLKTEHLDNVNENSSSCSPLGVEMPTSAIPFEDQDEKACVYVSAETDTSVNINREEAATKCTKMYAELLQGPSVHSSHGDVHVNSSDRMTLEERSNNYSDVSHDHDHVKSSEQEVDYDSQYEDGEVRESIVHAWEEYDGEDMDVDYGSDNAKNLTCDAVKTMKHTQETNFQPCLSCSSGSGRERSSKGKEGMDELESVDEAGPVEVTGDDLVDREDDRDKPSLSADSTFKFSGRWGHRKFSDSMTGVGDGGSRKNLTDGCMDEMSTEGTKMRIIGSREFRRELRSHIEGRALQDGYVKEKAYMQRSSVADNSNPKSVREPGYVESFGRVRYSHRAHAKGDHWVNSIDSHRSLKRYRSPNYCGPTSFRRPCPDNASSLTVHRHLRRRSPVDRDEAFRFHLGFRPSREMSPGRHMTRGRGRSLRNGPRLDGRGPRGRYHGHMVDYCSGPSLNHSHPPSKRERSFSFVERRGEDPARIAPSKSPPRSRTRSPDSYCSGPSLNHSHPPSKRERSFSFVERRGEDPARIALSKSPPRSRTRSPDSGNPSSGPHSKSPNVRSEVRMQRGRSPLQRSGFVADSTVGRKMHRNHGSPPHHNSRWVGDRKDGMSHFREQVRFGPRDEKFDIVDSPRNYRSIHTGRFLEVVGVGRGRRRCDGDDDTREKCDHRFGLVPPAKRFDMDGPVKRFQYNVDEGFVQTRNSRYGDATEFYGRGGPKQLGRGSGRDFERLIGDGPRRCREERGPLKPQRDGKYNANPKSFGVHESGCDKSAS